MNNDLKHIFSDTPCPEEEMLIRYIGGDLGDTDKRKIEIHLNDCEMCSDFIEGLSAMKDTSQWNAIEKELHSKIDALTVTEKKMNIPFFLRIAATIILLTGLTFIIFYQYSSKENKKIEVAQNTEKITSDPVNGTDTPDTPETPAPTDNTLITVEGGRVTAPAKTPLKVTLEEDAYDDGIIYDASKQQGVVSRNEPNSTSEKLAEDVRPFSATTTGNVTKTPGTSGYIVDKLKESEIKEEENVSKVEHDAFIPVSVDAEAASKDEKTVVSEVTVASKTSPERAESMFRGGKKAVKEKSKDERYKANAGDGKANVNFTTAEIPAQEETPLGGSLADRDRDSNREQNIEGAKNKFDKGEYQQTIQILENSDVSGKESEEALYYRGISYYKLNNYQKAYEIFKELKNSKSTLLLNDIQWYYAMTLMYLGYKEESRKIFEVISGSASPYAPDARRELEKLK